MGVHLLLEPQRSLKLTSSEVFALQSVRDLGYGLVQGAEGNQMSQMLLAREQPQPQCLSRWGPYIHNLVLMQKKSLLR